MRMSNQQERSPCDVPVVRNLLDRAGDEQWSHRISKKNNGQLRSLHDNRRKVLARSSTLHVVALEALED